MLNPVRSLNFLFLSLISRIRTDLCVYMVLMNNSCVTYITDLFLHSIPGLYARLFIITPGSLASLRIKRRCDWTDGSSRLYSTSNDVSYVTTLHTPSPCPWRSPALPPGRLPPLGCSGFDASLPPPLWSSYQRVSGQDGCCKPGKAFLGWKSSITMLFYSGALIHALRLVCMCRALW